MAEQVNNIEGVEFHHQGEVDGKRGQDMGGIYSHVILSASKGSRGVDYEILR